MRNIRLMSCVLFFNLIVFLSVKPLTTAQSYQNSEISRVNDELDSLTFKSFPSRLTVLTELVSSVAANVASHPTLIYSKTYYTITTTGSTATKSTSTQADFIKALTNLHNDRIKTDLNSLNSLRALYVSSLASRLIADSTSPYPPNATYTSTINTFIAAVDLDLAALKQSVEMARVNGVLSGLTGKTFADQFTALKNLVTSVATNSAVNSTLYYTSVQTNFLNALANMHAMRPTTDLTVLGDLKTWYSSIALNTSKLLAAYLPASYVNDINSDIADIELIRVSGVLTSLTASTPFATMFTKLKDLVTSVATNVAANPVLVYTLAQPDFLVALTNLHNLRPKTDSTVLGELKTWYTSSGLTTSKLLANSLPTAFVTDVDKDLVQIEEITRVNGILAGLTGKTFTDQFTALQNLVTSVATNASANSGLVYTSVQAAFATALANLHKLRPVKDPAALGLLKAWYQSSDLSSTKLLAASLPAYFVTDIDKDLAAISKVQTDEMTRVAGVLSALSGKTFADQFTALQNLITSVATNAASNADLDYSSKQSVFMSAVDTMHSARPTTDKTKLQSLKTWYESTALTSSKLVPAGTSFTQKISDIVANITSIDQAAVLAAAQAAEMTSVQNVLNGISTKDFAGKFADLQTLVTTVAANVSSNSGLDYTSKQAAFMSAVDAMHALRPTTDKVILQSLKVWYESTALTSSKLVPTGTSFAQKISDVVANIASIDQAAGQTAEMVRVQGILDGLGTKDFAGKFADLQTLVTTAAANGASNSALDYSPMQAAFMSAVDAMHAARPTTDKTKLQSLKTWYESTALTSSKLVPTGTSFAQKISDVVANIASLDAAVTPPTTTTPPTTGTTVDIDAKVKAGLAAAYKKTTISTKCAALSAVITKYKNNTVAAATSNYLFTSIMTPIYTKINAYKSPLKSAQKTERNACVAFFKNAAGSKLLTAPQKASVNQAITILNKKK